MAATSQNTHAAKELDHDCYEKLLLAFTVLGATALAHADDNFASLTLGQTSDKVKKSNALDSALNNPNADGVIGKDTTYGLRLGKQNDQGRYYATYDNVSGTHNGIKLRQENLLGSYDVFYPVTSSTKLFGGGTVGLTKLTQDSPGFSRDSDIGYAVGLQGACCNKFRKTPRLNWVTVTCAAMPAPR